MAQQCNLLPSIFCTFVHHLVRSWLAIGALDCRNLDPILHSSNPPLMSNGSFAFTIPSDPLLSTMSIHLKPLQYEFGCNVEANVNHNPFRSFLDPDRNGGCKVYR